MELETEFEITIPDEEAERIRTVGEAIEYVEREVASRRSTAANS
jgi:acyl carrier protein